jgi:DNA repair exonuclease SbcCD nuclease subunit
MYHISRNLAEHKVALISDTHFGARKGSQVFHDYFKDFYDGTFFQYIDRHNIKSVVHLGDCFDVRKGIDYFSLDWAKTNFFDPLKERGIDVTIIVGNHDIFYRNTLKVNSPRLNLREYDNVTIIDSPQTYKGICMVPWICEDNAEATFEELKKSDAKWCMGHLELAGFYANKDYKCDHGTDPDHFAQFKRVFSGHFHKKSSKGNITYLGNPYQLFWNDEGETRGFHVFDTESGELEFIPNPLSMFHKINVKSGQLVNPNKYEKAYIKLIFEDQVSPIQVSNLVDQFYDRGCHDVKVIENVNIDVEDDVEVEAEDTLTTLTNYVNAMEDSINKESLVNIFKSLYVESQEV